MLRFHGLLCFDSRKDKCALTTKNEIRYQCFKNEKTINIFYILPELHFIWHNKRCAVFAGKHGIGLCIVHKFFVLRVKF